MKELLILLSILIVGISLLLCVCLSDVPVSRTYTNSITLHNAEELPTALTNAMSKVSEKGFILTKVRTSHNFLTGSYTVEVGGREPEQLTSLDK